MSVVVLSTAVSESLVRSPVGVTLKLAVAVMTVLPMVFLSTWMIFSRAVVAVSGAKAKLTSDVPSKVVSRSAADRERVVAGFRCGVKNQCPG